jgi:hypothetical protein
MSLPEIYGERFVDSSLAGSFCSARTVVPIVLSVVGPKTVIDIGCGTGAWLYAFEEMGVQPLAGVDGNQLHPDSYLVDPRLIVSQDLEQPLVSLPTADLVVCLEVAEHLTPSRAESLIDELCKLSDAVLFSAAVPHQVGTNHINLRWPSYWADLFRSRGFEVSDPVRPRIWSNEDVEWWYRQNTLLYLRTREGPPPISELLLDVVHPELWEQAHHGGPPSLRSHARSSCVRGIRRSWSALQASARRLARSRSRVKSR